MVFFFFCVVVIMPLCMRLFLMCHCGCAHVLCVPKYTAVATEKNQKITENSSCDFTISATYKLLCMQSKESRY